MIKISTYKNHAIINASAEAIFNTFLDSIKKDFKPFSEESAVGSKVQKTVGAYSNKSGQVEIEIKAFERNKVYEIESISPNQRFTSRYELEVIDENTTKLWVTETVATQGFLGSFNDILVGFVFKKGIKNRFEHMVASLNAQLKEATVKKESTG